MGVGDGVDPTILTSLDGSVLIRGGGAVDLSTGGGVIIPPGPNSNALIVAAIVAGQKVLQLGPGTYTLEAPLFTGLTPAQLSGVDIEGSGQSTILTPSYTSAAGLASTPTNALVLVQGLVVSATYNSVLTRHAIIGDRTIAVAANATAMSGQWLRLNGHNDPATAMGSLAAGANITATEIVQVESVGGAGLIATLRGNLMQEHTITNGGTGVVASVQAVTPVVGFRLANMTLLGTTRQIATGILLDYVVEPILEDLWFEGFSMADCFARLGTRTIKFRDFVHRGGSNCWLFLQSVCGGTVERETSTGRGDRFHPLGLLQGAVNMSWNTTQIDYGNFDLRRACRGLQVSAVMQINMHDGLVDDMFIQELLNRPAIAENTFCGVGFDGGRGPLADTAFSMGVRMTDVRFTNCRSNGPIDPLLCPYTAFLHDILDLEVDISIINEGESPYAVVDGNNYVMLGVLTQDSGGQVSAVIRGCEFAWSIRSVSGRMNVDELTVRANPGAGTVTAFSSYQQSVIHNGLTYGRLDVQSPATYSNTSPQDVVRVESLSADGFEFRSTTTMVNGTGITLQVGDLCQPDPAGVATTFQPTTVIAAAANVPLAVCCTSGGQAVNGRAFDGCALPTTDFVVNVTAAAVVPNDRLDWGAGVLAKTNNAAPVHTAIGRSLSFKAAGAAGMVRAGGVT